MSQWKAVQQCLEVLLAKVQHELSPDKIDALRSKHCGEVSVQRYSSFEYGGFGIGAYRLRGRRAMRIAYEDAARAWIRTVPLCLADGVTEAHLAEVLGREAANCVVYSFIQDSAEQILRGRDPSAKIADYQRQFNERAAKTFHIEISCPLFGCAVLEEAFHYAGDGLALTIRRPEKKDLARLPRPRLYDLGEHLPDALLTLQTSDAFSSEHAQLRRILTALVLYKPGCVTHGDYSTTGNSFGQNLKHGGGSGSGKPPSKMYLRLWSGDAMPLSSFLDAVLPLLPADFFKSGQAVTPLALGIGAYRQALFETSVWERQVANAVMAIEALLMGDSQGDLKFRAAFRSARLAGEFGYEPLDTRDLVLIAYDVRSAYVHGSRCKAETLKKIKKAWNSPAEFSQRVCDVVRAILLGSMVVKHPKEQLQKEIDRAMLSIEAAAGLTAACVQVRELNRPYLLVEPFYDHLDYLQSPHEDKVY
jgi:hypothetical protein